MKVFNKVTVATFLVAAVLSLGVMGLSDSARATGDGGEHHDGDGGSSGGGTSGGSSAEQPGSSSFSPSLITAVIPPVILITGDIALSGTYVRGQHLVMINNGERVAENTSLGTGAYTLVATVTDGGSFILRSKSGTYTIPFTPTWTSGGATLNLPYNKAQAFTGAAFGIAPGPANAQLKVTVFDGDMAGAVADTYQNTLVLTVFPG